MKSTSEIELLTKLFLAGETSLDEERRLYELLKHELQKHTGVTEEQRVLMDIICPLPVDKADNNAEVLQGEDESGVYDSIMRKRRMRITFMRWAVAAVFVGLVFMAWMNFGNKGIHKDMMSEMAESSSLATHPSKESGTHVESTEANTAGTDIIAVRKPGIHADEMAGTEASTDKAAVRMVAAATASDGKEIAIEALADVAELSDKKATEMTAADSMEMLIDRMEHDLANIDDSVYLSHVEQIIKADKRFQKLMNRIIVNDLTRQARNEESHNMDNEYE
ncbi:hypothetical protein [Xylanibacter muris]|uniref:Anti-sigma factor n=1 Tax=Xylanibacter muris TaxID=2736290 RepID=A0ABX2AL42_9BACT|nr:hypothetical protein [Xylanibacter muris]NPD90757.1 hypothetical protein [Xylanibacter muris]